MGYIFDALNKKQGTNDRSQDEAVDAVDCTADIQAENASPSLVFPVHVEDTLSEEEASDPELRFDSDPVSKHRANNEDTRECNELEGLAHSEPDEIDPPAVQGVAEVKSDRPLATLTLSRPKPWWQWWRTRQTESGVDDRLVGKTNPGSALAEEYRAIRTTLLARHNNERHLVHTITSATPQEGKTITCMNLGLAFAELHNRKTIVIECDLRLPTFEKLLRLDHPTGLIPYLRGEITLADAISTIGPNGLDVITAGGRANNDAVQLLSSPRMTALIQSLRTKYDHVIIDTPPAVELADAGILGAQSDDVLLVARMRRTPRPLIEQAVRTLTGYNAAVVGMVATDNPRFRQRGYGSKYGSKYGYAYAYGQSASKRSRKQRGRRAA